MNFFVCFNPNWTGGEANIVGHIVVGNQGGQSLVASAGGPTTAGWNYQRWGLSSKVWAHPLSHCKYFEN